MLVRSLIEPCLASVCSVPGSGMRATSGGAPPETAASRTVSMLDPLLAYWTVTPVPLSKGESAAVNAACSPLLHSAQRLTEPPCWLDDVGALDVPHALKRRTPTTAKGKILGFIPSSYELALPNFFWLLYARPGPSSRGQAGWVDW